MLNTIFNCLTAKRNASPVLAFQVTPKDKAIFDKYFTYYVNDGYSEDEAKLISDVFQESADDADVHENIDIRNLQPTNYLSLCLVYTLVPKGQTITSLSVSYRWKQH